MVLADLLYTLSQHTLIHDHWTADLARVMIAVLSSITAVLLAKMYVQHRTGRMNRCAGVGAVATYAVISWAQLIAISTPGSSSDLTALNVGVLAAVILSLVGTFQAMEVHLFKATDPRPGRWKRALGQLDHMADVMEADAGKLDGMTETMDSNAGKLDSVDVKLDQIDHAVNNRRPDQSTISEDVADLVERPDSRNLEDER